LKSSNFLFCVVAVGIIEYLDDFARVPLYLSFESNQRVVIDVLGSS
jgi:hypothetical protein